MILYLESEQLLENGQVSQRLVLDSPHFELIDGVLYRDREFTLSLQSDKEIQTILSKLLHLMTYSSASRTLFS